MQQALTNHRRNLHRIPEIGFELPKTKAYILDALKHVRAEIEEPAESGLTYYFDAGKRDSVAFRADMDALAIEEANQAPYASTHPGRMHACGHDAHMAMLIAFAEHVDRHIAELPHNVLLIFQPAEESGGGGQLIAQSGTLERHHVQRIYALHVDPHLSIGEVGSRPGAFMARASEVWLKVTGRSAHVGRAAEGIDATWACADFYRRAVLMEQSYQGQDRKLLKFGLLQSGVAQNVLSASATLGGTMRTYSEQDFQYMKSRLLEIAEEIAAQTGARMELTVMDGYPPVINDPAAFEAARAALSDLPFVTFDEPSLLGEDFSCYLQRVPGAMLYIGVGRVAPLHAPTFDFDERALMTGLEVYKRLVRLA